MVCGAAHVSRAFELGRVVTNEKQNVFEEAICNCPEGGEHDHPSGWLLLPFFQTVLVPPDLYDAVYDRGHLLHVGVQFFDVRVAVLRTSDGKTTQVFHGTSSNEIRDGWESVFWQDDQKDLPNMEGPGRLTLRTSVGIDIRYHDVVAWRVRWSRCRSKPCHSASK
jgi:hypothetical protein